MPDKIMVVTGGMFQIPIIKKAKQLGLEVIVTDKCNNALGFADADKYKVVDTLNLEEILNFSKGIKPNGIITDQSDLPVKTVAYLCETLGLPGIGIEKAELFTNKFLMREFCKNHGFLYPNYKLCFSFPEAYSFAKSIGFPLVLKPVNNQSSKGVYKINSEKELDEKYNNTLEHSNGYGIMVEQFIRGTELTVEGFKTHEKHFSLAVSKKEHLPENNMVACRLLYTNDDSEIDYNKLKNINNNLVEMMELPFGLTHAEYKYFNGSFYLIEIAARGGGTKISSDIVPLISGIDTNKLLINCALGNFVKDIQIIDRKICVVLDFFVLKKGKVRKIKGIDSIKSIKQIIDLKLNFKEGDIIQTPSDDSTRAGYFIAFEQTKNELEALCNKVKNTLVVEYE